MLKHPSQEAKGKESEVGVASTTGPGKKEAVGQKLGSAPGQKQAKVGGWLTAIIGLTLSRKQISSHPHGSVPSWRWASSEQFPLQLPFYNYCVSHIL